ncbi:MAG: hypothetical protein E6738_04660 [Campylobacter concisus]|jgi:hypothetical protein|uniref:hypothetical protein n=1 Tax=Campylobacter concisus TaxID=199 RepID=UPI0015E197A5|nr:hypothetical protein [Campylobacter concisus]MDU2008920.1 hypothetical protein [Campylobacter concisus]DAN53355.1 MAG TPA: hypothetical protein [Caudoviricetes sp.]DAO42567.1 MAG TPA: hypothetical protein [Caudoviricetes sp.]
MSWDWGGSNITQGAGKNGGGFLSWLGGGDAGGVPNWLTALGTGGALWSAYNQNKAAKQAFKLNKDAYDFNKMLSQRQLQRENQANQNLVNAWNASNFHKQQEEEAY